MSQQDPPEAQPRPKRDQHIVLYDSDCPLCLFQMKVLTWLDWFHVAALKPIKDPEAAALAPHLTRENLLEAIHCIARDGKIHRGARAIRFLGLRMPLLMPVGLFLWFPGVIVFAEIFYRIVSHNRLFFSRIFGCREACAILPKRHRDEDRIEEG